MFDSKCRRPLRSRLVTVAIFLGLGFGALAAPLQAREIVSYALVNDDATLTVRNKRIHLYGIHIPPTGRFCQRNIEPVRCASRAALALDFRIQGFVRCRTVVKHRDRSLTAQCTNRDIDLSEYLLSRGWALALPNAPFGYHALERIAEKRSVGVWGIHADVITRGR